MKNTSSKPSQNQKGQKLENPRNLVLAGRKVRKIDKALDKDAGT